MFLFILVLPLSFRVSGTVDLTKFGPFIQVRIIKKKEDQENWEAKQGKGNKDGV